MSQSTDWDTAEAAVKDGTATLRNAKTHRDIRAWAKDAEVATKALWPKVKTELRKQLDIDYDQLRSDTTATEAAALADQAATAPLLELCSAGDDEVASYAVCAADDDHESWYGEFHANDLIYRSGDALSAERSAAEKAVFLAGKTREKAGLETVRLTLFVSHHELTTEHLASTAAKHRVAVTLELSENNPAIELCRAPGYRTWREIKLDSLFSKTAAGE